MGKCGGESTPSCLSANDVVVPAIADHDESRSHLSDGHAEEDESRQRGGDEIEGGRDAQNLRRSLAAELLENLRGGGGGMWGGVMGFFGVAASE